MRKVAHHDDLLRNSRQVKQRRRVRKWGWAALGVFLIVLAAVLVLNLSRFLISDVVIKGAETINPETLQTTINEILDQRYFYLISKRSQWLYPGQTIGRAILAKFPTLSAVTLTIDHQVMTASVSERKGAALWCHDQTKTGCYFSDDTGYIFAAAPEFSVPIFPIFETALPTEPIGTRPLTSDLFQTLLIARQDLVSFLKEENLGEIDSVRLALPDLNFLVTQSGDSNSTFAIKLRQDQDILAGLINVKAALQSEAFVADQKTRDQSLEYVDARFPPKVFYKFRGSI